MWLQRLCCTIICIAVVFPDQSTTQDNGSTSATNATTGYTFGTPGRNATFDYVIVGGGTAGLTVAKRLAENPSVSIAVIEAGGFYEADAGNVSVVPAYDILFAGTSPLDTNPLIDWGFTTTPQAGAAGRKLHYARGKTLGGSSARNFMFYHRPSAGSLDQWADQVGDPSYTFKNMLAAFTKSVHYTPPSIQYKNSSNDQDGNGFCANCGPLQVSFGRYEDPFGTWAQKAFQAVGQAAIRGFQNGQLIGSGYMPFTEDPVTAHRSSSESSFLESTKNMHVQLKIYNNTLAERIIFQGSKNRAAGVTVSSYGINGSTHGTPYTLNARNEIIISAGTFQSPQLLMVSGIGPRSTLTHFNIPVLHDLPGVGQNLQDQPFFGTTYRVDLSTASAAINNASLAAAAVSSYLNNASGPLTNADIPVISFEKLPASSLATLSPQTRDLLSTTFAPDWPHLEFLPIGTALSNGSNFATVDPHDGHNYATIATALVAPLSRGNITLSSASMTDPPLINPAWLSHLADQEVAVAAFKRQREVWAALSPITIGAEYSPGTDKVNTDAEILSYIQKTLIPIWHAAGTCKMGRRHQDPMAVIDNEMKVYGTQRLRVVDASSMPFLPPGHPQSTVFALAETAAFDILEGLTDVQ